MTSLDQRNLRVWGILGFWCVKNDTLEWEKKHTRIQWQAKVISGPNKATEEHQSRKNQEEGGWLSGSAAALNQVLESFFTD